MAAPATKAFWTSRAVSKTAQEVKTTHVMERNADKQARWQVRKNVSTDGVVSNLYGIAIDKAATVHRYDLDVCRRARANVAATSVASAIADMPNPNDNLAAAHVRKSLPVSPTRAWRMYAQSLRKYPALPPLVRVAGRIYAAAALPAEVQELHKDYHDQGWERCCLAPVGAERLASLPPPELKSVVNKMLPWALSFHARRDGNFAVVRELDGKMVCTEDGISVAGLRVFRGTTATILHVTNGDVLSASEEYSSLPTSRYLQSITQAGTNNDPMHVRCQSLVRMFQYQGKQIGVYLVEDSSGSVVLQLWGATPDSLIAGQSYLIKGVKVSPAEGRFNAGGTIPWDLSGTTAYTEIKPADVVPETNLVVPTDAKSHVGLALRLDTRCTVASEKSLWEEVKQHFGEGPYDQAKQRMITRALQGTPVILSTNLRHTAVRSVRFDYATPQDAPVDGQLRTLYQQLDRHQPYAVVSDFSVVPVQALHCCFDPRMRSWQEVTVPACSFMPLKRHDILEKFRNALTDGLGCFGVSLQADALATKRIALLDEPQRRGSRAAVPAGFTSASNAGGAKPPSIAASLGPSVASANANAAQRPRLRTVVIVAIAHPRGSQDDADKVTKTAETLGRVFRTQFVRTVPGEQEAAAYLDQVLLPGGKLTDPDCAAVIVSPDRDTRPARWLQAECLRRGILPEFIRGSLGERRQKLIGETTKMQLLQKLAFDPVRDYNLISEVPLLGRRTTLVVGVDACHTNDVTTGTCAGMLIAPEQNHMLVHFWRNNVRGKEVEQVSKHFGAVVDAANAIRPIEEVVVFQDGDVYSELESMAAKLPASANLSFLCLHKRTHIRFTHSPGAGKHANVIKGAVVESLTPTLTPQESTQVPSFFLQCHDCFMSTTRTVQYKVHQSSPQFPMSDLQKLSYTLAHVGSPMSTKLPLPTRCAHRLSAIAERLVDANPSFKSTMIPDPLCRRLWFM
jgi:hypothetical protein